MPRRFPHDRPDTAESSSRQPRRYSSPLTVFPLALALPEGHLDGRLHRGPGCSSGAGRRALGLDDHALEGCLARRAGGWEKRDLSARRYLYFWADGIYFQPRMEHDKQCTMGPQGTAGNRRRLSRERPVVARRAWSDSLVSWPEGGFADGDGTAEGSSGGLDPGRKPRRQVMYFTTACSWYDRGRLTASPIMNRIATRAISYFEGIDSVGPDRYGSVGCRTSQALSTDWACAPRRVLGEGGSGEGRAHRGGCLDHGGHAAPVGATSCGGTRAVTRWPRRAVCG